MEKEINTWSNNLLICPYCGHGEIVKWSDFEGEDGECDDVEFECPECGKFFLASRRIHFTYHTYKNENEE